MPKPDKPELRRFQTYCRAQGLRVTKQRLLIARIILAADDHPNADELLARARKVLPSVSPSTLYRTLKLLQESKLVARHEFAQDSASRFEAKSGHHDHLIDQQTGEVVEFYNEELEELQKKIARGLGYRLTHHRMELYGTRIRK
ncbi:MAG: transcriptional repressor [Alphaproteobacteria bacterium]|nr:transcriptional repressor [Alphaproteobacteria bacterium]MDA8003726.1 transcriptional repressor [Alphaproteobacteria bacterium]MDA8005149.1 transcriptional repressor [Alphaproteobacteria bacterium]MDA8013047.1 transcriptional repressor [Alphaproteobacteria bacterium]